MDIQIRNIERTCLDEYSYKKLIRKFSKSLNHDLLIVFDKRLKCFGNYTFNEKRNIHIIRISPDEHKKDEKAVEQHWLFETTLHELRHVQQKEKLGKSFDNKNYNFSKDIKTKRYKEYYSELEIDARSYEQANILKAVRSYNEYLQTNI